MEVDLTKLAEVLSQAITQTLAGLAVQEQSPPAKKRGRPKKEKTQVKKPPKIFPVEHMGGENTFLGNENDEKVKDILDFEAPMPTPERAKNNYIATAKRVGSGDKIQNTNALEDFKKDLNRKIKFVDDPSVGDKIDPNLYPERSDRRPPAQMGKFTCAVCHKPFEGSYKEFPQALQNFRDAQLQITNECLVKCNDCSTKPVG